MLSGTRVLDLGWDAAGAFAARLYALYGATVTRVEPPGGDPVRLAGPRFADGPETGIPHAYLSAGKRSAIVDPRDADAVARLRAHAAAADVVIVSGDARTRERLPLPIGELRAPGSRTVLCAITPFGLTGPRASWSATALVASAAGGQLWMCGDADEPPLKTAGNQAHMQGGLHGFAASLAALYAARETGLGELLDLSLQEVQMASLEGGGPAALVRGFETPRTGNGMLGTWSIYPCADGYVGVHAMARQGGAIFRAVGHPEMAEDPQFLGFGVTPENNEAIRAIVSGWMAERTVEEIYAVSSAFRAPFSLLATPGELLTWASLQEQGFWRWVEHPVIGQYPLPAGPIIIDGWRGEHSAAPLLDEHQADIEAAPAASVPHTEDTDRRPLLDGVRVIDLTQVWAGPYGTRLLADMGADVIKVEGPSFPDAVRTGLPGAPGTRTYNTSTYFNEYARNKRDVTLDLQQEEGRALLLRLVEEADVVIENWSAGVADRLGIGYETLRAVKADIIMVSMPGFGLDNSESQRIAYGPAIEQMGGLVALQGYEGGPPHKSGISYGDPIAGVTAAAGVFLGLLRRRDTGKGARVVVPQRDGIIGLIGEYVVAEALGRPLSARIGNRDAEFAPHGVYRTRDDSGRFQGDVAGNRIAEICDTWLAIAVDGEAAWHGLKAVIRDSHLDDPAFVTAEGRRAAAAEIDAVISAWCADLEPLEAAQQLQAAGVPASPVLSPLMLRYDEHILARDGLDTVEHPDVGQHLTAASAWRLTERPRRAPRPAPLLGEHNREVLASLLGLTDVEIEGLEGRGIISDAPLTA